MKIASLLTTCCKQASSVTKINVLVAMLQELNAVALLSSINLFFNLQTSTEEFYAMQCTV